LNDNGFILRRDGLLRSGFQITGGLCLGAHELDRVQHFGLLTLIGIAERGGPGKILIHVGKDGGKLRERFHAGVPIFLVHFGGQVGTFQVGIVFEEMLSVFDFAGIGGAGQDLSDQRIGVQSDGRHHLLQLIGRQWRGLRLSLLRGL
jgi:hypothetical protein